MKKKYILALLPLYVLSSCTSASATPYTDNECLLKLAKSEESIEEKDASSQGFKGFVDGLDQFAGDFTHEYYQTYDEKDDNSVVSPLSVYSAFLIASGITCGNTRKEILDTLNAKDDANLPSYIRTLYHVSQKEKETEKEGEFSLKETLRNSIWFDKSVPLKDQILDTLSENLYTSSYGVDFQKENEKSNKTINEYVEKMTNGLIKPNFNFEDTTQVVLMNTLYLKTLWNEIGEDLELSKETFTFTERDSSKNETKLLVFPETTGRAFKGKDYSSYKVVTDGGMSLRFILPDSGKDIHDVMNGDTINEVIKATYDGIDDKEGKEYLTTCYFPQFTAESNHDISSIMADMGIHDFFGKNCDNSPLSDAKISFDKVKHIAKLEVSKKGIEGAAVTVVVGDGGSKPSQYEKIHEKFVVDRAFGYVLTDRYGIPLFTGITNTL